MKAKTIKIPLYFHKLRIVVADKLSDTKGEAVVYFGGTLIELHIKPTASIEIIAHESVHIANRVFKRCGIAPDLKNDEPQAYLVGWVADQIWKTINSFKNRGQ